MELAGIILLFVGITIYKLIRWDSVEIRGHKYYINIFGNRSF
jgi:hypothetical protein